MALTQKSLSLSSNGAGAPGLTASTEVKTPWIVACDAPETADNAGSAVVAPLSLTRSALSYIDVRGKAKRMFIRLKYNSGLTSITDPVVQPFGFSGPSAESPIGEPLKTSAGTHAITLANTTGDFTLGSYKYTDPVEVALNGNDFVMVAIKTALNGTGTKTDSEVLVRFA